MKNGRPDTGFLHWKWQPEKCDLPRIDAQAFLNAMRNKSMTFAGDSIARNQFQSLLCLLSQVYFFTHSRFGSGSVNSWYKTNATENWDVRTSFLTLVSGQD